EREGVLTMPTKGTPVKGHPQVWKMPNGYAARQPWRGGRMRTFAKLDQALAFQRKSATARDEGRPTTDVDGAQAKRESAVITMTRVWQAYSELMAGSEWSASTAATRHQQWAKLKPIVGTMHPDDLTKAHATATRSTLKRMHKLSDSTVTNHL